MISAAQNSSANDQSPDHGPPDGRLLHVFALNRDEAAFATIVRRHGPMVLGICRRILGNEHDAADAFQAVFIVLARKVASIRNPEVLGAWLYNVAFRASMKARAVRCKRHARESQVNIMPEPAVESAVAVDDLMDVLDEELSALPVKYQAPVILCDLQGHSRKDVAQKLNLTEGTLSSRLATARKKLAARLRRRGVTVSAAALATILAESAASASVPVALVAATLKASCTTAAGQATAGLASESALAISQGVLKGMLLAKLKAVFLVLFTVCVAAGAVHMSLNLVAPAQDEEAKALAILQRLGAKIRWEVQPTGKQVVKIDLKRTKVQDEHMGLLPVFKELRELWLTETAVTDEGCKALAGLTKLEVLRMNGAAVTDAGLGPIAGLARLKVVALGWTKITDAGVKTLAPLSELRDLTVRQTGVTGACLRDLAAFQKLSNLELSNNKITDANLKDLAALPELRVLRLDATGVSNNGLKDLATCVPIEFLAIEDNPGITDAGLKDLAPMPRLGGLSLSGTPLTEAALDELTAFKGLRWLALDRTAITGAGFKDGSAFSLTTLWLNDSKVNDATLKNVAALGALQTLFLEKTAVSDVGVKELARLNTLETLSLEKTKVTDACLKHLAGLKRLWTLNLNGTKVTDAGLKDVAALSQLRWLALHNTAVTDAGLKDLAALNDLGTLWLSWTKVTDAGLKELGVFKKLQTLRLGGTNVTDTGLRDLAVLKRLQALWLDWTKVTDEGMKELANLRELEELRLEGTAVTEAGLKQLVVLKKLERVELKPAPAANEPKPKGTELTVEPALLEPEQAKSFWFLVILTALLAGGGLLAWLAVRRKSLVAPLLVVGGLLAVAFVTVRGRQPEPSEPVAPVEVMPKERRLKGHTGPVHCVQFTPDRRHLISASGWPGRDNSIRIWDLATDQELFRIQAPGQVGSMELAADGKHVLVGAMGGLLYIEIETGKVLKVFRGFNSPTGAVALAPDGRHVYSAHQDGFARRWDLEAAKELAKVRVAGKWARGVAELPGGRLFTADNAGLIQIWDLETGQETKRIDTGSVWMSAVNVLPGGRLMITGTWTATVWDLQTGNKVRSFKGHQAEIPQIALSPDGKTLLTVSFDGTARLWEFETGKPLPDLSSQEEFLFAGTFAHDGRLIAIGGGGRKSGKDFIGGSDHDIRIFELAAAPVEPVSAEETATEPWHWWLGLGGAIVLIVGGIVVVRTRRRSFEPATSLSYGDDALVLFCCSHCGKHLKVRSGLAGKKVKCPKCAIAVPVPQKV